jgi:hypothetical protein
MPLLATAERFNAALKGEIPVGRELEDLQGELQSIVEAR